MLDNDDKTNATTNKQSMILGDKYNCLKYVKHVYFISLIWNRMSDNNDKIMLKQTNTNNIQIMCLIKY